MLVQYEGEAIHYCTSLFCEPQIIGGLIHFVSKKAMNIDSLGEKTVELLYEKGKIRSISDFYSLRKEDFEGLEGFKEKSIENILQGIENSKSIPFEKVLYALGIRYIGETTAFVLATHFCTIDALISASEEDLLATPEIGEKIAKTLVILFKNKKFEEMIKKLKKQGLKFEIKQEETGKEKALDGLTVVATGAFENKTREDVTKALTILGAKCTSSVSSKTSFIFSGNAPGASKITKAKKLGIKILSPDDFFKEYGEKI